MLRRVSAGTTGLPGTAGLLTAFLLCKCKAEAVCLGQEKLGIKTEFRKYCGILRAPRKHPTQTPQFTKKEKEKKKGTRCPERVKAGLNAHSEAASGWDCALSPQTQESDALLYLLLPWGTTLTVHPKLRPEPNEGEIPTTALCWQAKNQTPGFLTISFTNINKTRTQIEFCSVLGA